MELSVVRESSRAYLRVEENEMPCDSYEEKMLCSLQSPALLPFDVQYGDRGARYKYDVTGRVSLREYWSGRMLDRDALLAFLDGITAAAAALEEYLLDPGALLLDADYIFVDTEHREVSFACIPGRQCEVPAALADIVGEMLEHADYNDRQCVYLVYELYRMVRSLDFRIPQLAQLSRSAEAASQLPPPPVPEPEAEEADEVQYEDPPLLLRRGGPSLPHIDLVQLLPKPFSMPLMFTVICIGTLVFFFSGAAEAFCRMTGTGLGPQPVTVLFLVSVSGAAVLLRRLFGYLQRKKEEEEKGDEFWGDLLTKQFVYDEPPDEPVRRRFKHI